MVLVHPEDASVAETIRMESLVRDVIAAGPGEILVHIGSCLRLLTFAVQ